MSRFLLDASRSPISNRSSGLGCRSPCQAKLLQRCPLEFPLNVMLSHHGASVCAHILPLRRPGRSFLDRLQMAPVKGEKGELAGARRGLLLAAPSKTCLLKSGPPGCVFLCSLSHCLCPVKLFWSFHERWEANHQSGPHTAANMCPPSN